MTREEALSKAATCLEKAEQSINVEHWQKYVNVAQLYLTLAHESRDAALSRGDEMSGGELRSRLAHLEESILVMRQQLNG